MALTLASAVRDPRLRGTLTLGIIPSVSLNAYAGETSQSTAVRQLAAIARRGRQKPAKELSELKETIDGISWERWDCMDADGSNYFSNSNMQELTGEELAEIIVKAVTAEQHTEYEPGVAEAFLKLIVYAHSLSEEELDASLQRAVSGLTALFEGTSDPAEVSRRTSNWVVDSKDGRIQSKEFMSEVKQFCTSIEPRLNWDESPVQRYNSELVRRQLQVVESIALLKIIKQDADHEAVGKIVHRIRGWADLLSEIVTSFVPVMLERPSSQTVLDAEKQERLLSGIRHQLNGCPNQAPRNNQVRTEILGEVTPRPSSLQTLLAVNLAVAAKCHGLAVRGAAQSSFEGLPLRMGEPETISGGSSTNSLVARLGHLCQALIERGSYDFGTLMGRQEAMLEASKAIEKRINVMPRRYVSEFSDDNHDWVSSVSELVLGPATEGNEVKFCDTLLDATDAEVALGLARYIRAGRRFALSKGAFRVEWTGQAGMIVFYDRSTNRYRAVASSLSRVHAALVQDTASFVNSRALPVDCILFRELYLTAIAGESIAVSTLRKAFDFKEIPRYMRKVQKDDALKAQLITEIVILLAMTRGPGMCVGTNCFLKQSLDRRTSDDRGHCCVRMQTSRSRGILTLDYPLPVSCWQDSVRPGELAAWSCDKKIFIEGLAQRTTITNPAHAVRWTQLARPDIADALQKLMEVDGK